MLTAPREFTNIEMTVAEALLDEAGAVVGAAGASGDTSDNDEAALIAAIADAEELAGAPMRALG